MAAGVVLGARLTAKPLVAGLADGVLGARMAFGLGGMAGHLATEDSLNGRAGPGLVVCFGGLGWPTGFGDRGGALCSGCRAGHWGCWDSHLDLGGRDGHLDSGGRTSRKRGALAAWLSLGEVKATGRRVFGVRDMLVSGREALRGRGALATGGKALTGLVHW